MPTARARTRETREGSAYLEELDRAVAIMEESERKGPDPVLVAKRILPDRVFERLLMQTYEMER